MSLRNRLALLVTPFLGPVLGVALMACGSSGSQAQEQIQPLFASDAAAITVTGAENFYADVLHQIGGTHVKVYSLLNDPNADPHQFESNASDARAVADSKLVLENGLGYDAFMDKLLGASPDPQRVVVKVQTLIGAQDGVNGHLWYDPTVMPRVAEAVSTALARLDPARATEYSANFTTFQESLKPLNDEVASLKQRYAGVPIAFTEPVFGYMAAAIGLSAKSPLEFMKAVEEGNDPPSRAVAEEQDLITKHQVKALLYNSQTVTRVTAKIKDLAAKNGVPVVGVSETEPPGMTFQDWQLSTLKRLDAALAT